MSAVQTYVLTFRFKHRVRSSLWFIPIMCVLGGVVLSTITLAIDRHYKFELIPKSYTGGPEAALQILSAIAAGMVNLAALVLTITMVVVQLATGQYSPRIVRPFVQDRPSQYAIGIFVVTFAHALLTMREIISTESDGQVPGLSVLVAFVLVVISIMVLVLYVNHIGQSLTVAGVIDSVSTTTTDLLHRRYNTSSKAQDSAEIVRANTGGVVFRVDTDDLVKEAKRAGCVIHVVPGIGEYVSSGATLCRVENDSNENLDHSRVRKAIALGPERTLNNDLAYGFRMLVDIALRSASDALRDPTTSVQAIDRLHDALRQLAPVEFPDGKYEDEDGILRVTMPEMSWDGYVRLAFEEIRETGSWSLQIVRHLRFVLEDLKGVAPPHRQAALDHQLQLLDDVVRERAKDNSEISVLTTADAQGIGSGVDVRQ